MNQLVPKTVLRRCAALALYAFGVLGSACKSTGPEAMWQKDKISANSDRVLWEVTSIALEKSGFPIGSGMEPGKLHATSGWRTSLAPFRGEGYREQCEILYTPAGPRTYSMQVRVKREKNDDIVKPLDLTYAKWVPEGDDGERAAIVMHYIKSLLGNEFKVEPRVKETADPVKSKELGK